MSFIYCTWKYTGIIARSNTNPTVSIEQINLILFAFSLFRLSDLLNSMVMFCTSTDISFFDQFCLTRLCISIFSQLGEQTLIMHYAGNASWLRSPRTFTGRKGKA